MASSCLNAWAQIEELKSYFTWCRLKYAYASSWRVKFRQSMCLIAQIVPQLLAQLVLLLHPQYCFLEMTSALMQILQCLAQLHVMQAGFWPGSLYSCVYQCRNIPPWQFDEVQAKNIHAAVCIEVYCLFYAFLNTWILNCMPFI